MNRKLAAACLVTAPLALAVATAVDPALGDTPEYGVYRQHPDAILWHSVLLHWAWVLFVPGLLGLLAPVRRLDAVPDAVAWVASVVGLVTFAALMSVDVAILALEQTVPDADVARVFDRFESYVWGTVGWQVPGLLGWAVAVVAGPLAAARARVVSWWTAGSALAGTALYFLFAIEPVPLCLAGPVVMLCAYAAAAVELVRGRPFGASGVPAAAEADTFGRFTFRAGLVCMVAAPVSFAIGMGTIPGGSYEPSGFVEHPTAAQVSAFFLHLTWVLFVPAVLTLMRVGGRFVRVAGTLTVLGLLNFSGLMLGDHTDLAARQVLGAGVADEVARRIDGYALFSLGWAVPGMVLSLVGLIAVAVAAGVDRLVPWWVPGVVVLGFVGFFVMPPAPATAVVGPLLLLVGFGLLARGAARRPSSSPEPASSPPLSSSPGPSSPAPSSWRSSS
ncbi:hypothetical protein GCM10009557_39530 [Virgisporangium ochraceum]